MDDQRAPQDRPAFPEDAVTWLVGSTPRSVVVLGSPAISGAFVAGGHDVTTIPSVEQSLAFPDRSVDVVVTAQGLPGDLADVARVLRPGGQLVLVWNDRDQRIPWTRKLDRLLGVEVAGDEPEAGIVNSALFGFVEERSFRYWQIVTGGSLEEMVRAELADVPADERGRKVAAARELYDDYGRGADGMQMPWVSRCFKATVVESAWATPRGLDATSGGSRSASSGASPGGTDARGTGAGGPTARHRVEPPVDSDATDLLLIDFR